MIFLDGMVPLFNAALNKRVVAKLRKRPLTKKASKSGMSGGCVETALKMAHRRTFCVQLEYRAGSSFSYHIGLWRRVRANLGTS